MYVSPELNDLWRAVVEDWCAGTLAGGDGEYIIKPRPTMSVTPTMFKCFEGGLSEEDITSIFDKVLEGRCLLKKENTYKGDLPSMEELAKTAKFKTALKPRIVKYLVE